MSAGLARQQGAMIALLDGAIPAALLEAAAGHPVQRPLSLLHMARAEGRRDKHIFFLAERDAQIPFALIKWGSGAAAAGLQREQDALARMRNLPDAVVASGCPVSWGPLPALGGLVTVDRYIPARSAYAQLRTDWWPRRLVAGHFYRAETWLTHFAAATRQPPQPFDAALLEEYIEAPLRRLLSRFGSGVVPPAALDATLRAARTHLGREVCLTAEHGDVWLANLLLPRRPLLYVVDWEHFLPAVLPGFDMLVFCATYTMDFPWRPFGWIAPEVAFARGFLRSTWMSSHIAHLLRAVCAASGLPLDMLPTILPAALARRALRKAESMPEGQSAADSSWLCMLQAWWERTPENRLESWRVV